MDRFDVVIVALPAGEEPVVLVSKLRRALEIDATAADAILRVLPAVVRAGVRAQEAEPLFHTLRELGAKVELRKAKQLDTSDLPLPDLPGLPSEPAPTDQRLRAAAAVASAPLVPIVRVPIAKDADASDGDLPTEEDPGLFYRRLVPCLLVPLRPPAFGWYATIILYFVFQLVISFFASYVPIVGLVVTICSTAIMLGLNARFYRACFWAELTGTSRPEARPELDPVWIKQDLMRAGFALLIAQLAIQLVTITYVFLKYRDGQLDPLTEAPAVAALFVLPFFYWPAGLAVMALSSDPLSFFRFPTVMRFVFGSIGTYLIAAAVGVVALSICLGVVAFLVSIAPMIALVASPILVAFPFAYMHGVQGALLGARTRSLPHLASLD